MAYTQLSRTLDGAFDFQQLKQNWMGEWNEGTIYKINDTVRVNGKAYVMNSTYHFEHMFFGQEYKPGVDTTNWTKVTEGTIYKGEWSMKDRHYKGDVVRYNNDYYQCVVDNFGGNPIYENGSLTTKWALIAKSSLRDKGKTNLSFGNYPPIGWTRNLCETNNMYGGMTDRGVSTINGNYEACFIGKMSSGRIGYGIGIRDDWNNAANDTNSSTYTYVKHSGFDFYDYQDGYRTTATGEAPRLLQMDGTDEHVLFLFDNGEVYACGYGANGGNGVNTTTDHHMPKRVGRSGGRGTGLLRDVKIIKVGQQSKNGGNNDSYSNKSCFALSDTGTVWCWGWNNYGQLGDGTRVDKNNPTLIPQGYFHNKKIVDMWMFGKDYASTCAQTEDGELYTWGYNGVGQLGTGDARDHARPERIKYNWQQYGGIKKVICNGQGSESVIVVLCNDGSLHGTGNIGDPSYPIWGSGTTTNTHVYNMTPFAWMLYSRANSLGIGNKRNAYGNLADIMRSTDDFWMSGDSAANFSMIAKAKGTGEMYYWGTNHAEFTFYQRVTGRDEYSGDNPISNQPNASFPVPLVMGNKTDIKYVGKGGKNMAMFLNSDGTTWTNARPGVARPWGRGLGENASDPTAQTQRGIGAIGARLPWETFLRDLSPAQPRWAEPIIGMSGYLFDSTSSGFFLLTTHGRVLYGGNDNGEARHGLDSGANRRAVDTNNSAYARLDI
jgi:Regulator of chromosome condensation (RCC1) repeat